MSKQQNSNNSNNNNAKQDVFELPVLLPKIIKNNNVIVTQISMKHQNNNKINIECNNDTDNDSNSDMVFPLKIVIEKRTKPSDFQQFIFAKLGKKVNLPKNTQKKHLIIYAHKTHKHTNTKFNKQ